MSHYNNLILLKRSTFKNREEEFDFNEWAFGARQTLVGRYMVECWNNTHPYHKMQSELLCPIEQTFIKMVTLWKQSKENNG